MSGTLDNAHSLTLEKPTSEPRVPPHNGGPHRCPLWLAFDTLLPVSYLQNNRDTVNQRQLTIIFADTDLLEIAEIELS